MATPKSPSRDDILEAIRALSRSMERPPSKREFCAQSGIGERHILQHFQSWNEAVEMAGLSPHITNRRLDDADLLSDWGRLVRKLRRIPTVAQYTREGEYSEALYRRRLGPWSGMPDRFRQFAANSPEWADVLALLPQPVVTPSGSAPTVQQERLDAETSHSLADVAKRLGAAPVRVEGWLREFGITGDRKLLGTWLPDYEWFWNVLEFGELAEECFGKPTVELADLLGEFGVTPERLREHLQRIAPREAQRWCARLGIGAKKQG